MKLIKNLIVAALVITAGAAHADSKSAGRKLAQDMNWGAADLAQVKQVIVSNVRQAGGDCNNWSVNLAMAMGEQMPNMSDDAQEHLQTYIYKVCLENQ